MCENRSAQTSEGAGLELLVSQLKGHPGVEHGGPQFGPHPVIRQAEDLGSKLSGSLRGKDRGTAETCREGGGAVRVADMRGTKCDDRRSAALTTRHTEGGPDILCTPVGSERRAVDDGIGCVSRHHRTETVAPASHSHKHCGYAIT